MSEISSKITIKINKIIVEIYFIKNIEVVDINKKNFKKEKKYNKKIIKKKIYF